MFGRSKPTKTQSEMIMDELSESYGHLRQAAGHVAGGAAEVVTPRYDWARHVAAKGWEGTRGAFQPMVDQMRTGAANARSQYPVEPSRRNRWPALFGLLAAGAAVGAAAAMVVRRRRAAEWDEYEPIPPMAESPFDTDTRSATQKVSAGAAALAESASTQAGKVAESLRSKSDMPSSGASPTGGSTSGSAAGGSAAGGSTSGSAAGGSAGSGSAAGSKGTSGTGGSKSPSSGAAADKP